MHAIADLKQYRQTEDGTDIIIHIPRLMLGDLIKEKTIRQAEVRFDDGRHISSEQRRKIYATLRDIADYNGDTVSFLKDEMKTRYVEETGNDWPSFSDCSIDTAREVINTIMNFAIENGIPLSDLGTNRTDDIGKYLYFCIKHKKCCVCGKPGEIHHVDAIGMGNDRRKVDDSNHRKMCLCRLHHTIAHQRGMDAFEQMYKVYGIVVKEVV